MKDDYIVGKEFLGVYFDKVGFLSCDSSYDRFMGKIGIVENINESHNEYAKVVFKCIELPYNSVHFPVEAIKKQLKFNEYKQTTEYIKDLFKEVINLTKTK